jgi:lipoprotein-releasing system ATP-binding protein
VIRPLSASNQISVLCSTGSSGIRLTYADAAEKLFCVPSSHPDVTSHPNARPVLIAKGVSKTYGAGHTSVTAVARCDVTLVAAQIVAVVGPSGSGKSTLLHLLAGLDTPTQGSVTVAGRDLAAMTEAQAAAWRSREVGFVLQRDNLIPALTLRENVAAPLLFGGMPRRRGMEQADAILDRVGLLHRAHALPAEVSGGEAQRAAVARACVSRPILVFADEPTGALDQATGSSVIRLLQEVVRESGAAAMVVTHDEHVACLADRALLIEDGRVVDRRYDGTPAALR